MKTIIEYNGKPAFLNAEHGYLRTEEFVSIRPGELVELCGYHDEDRSTHNHLVRLGYNVSTGVCEQCKHAMIEQYEQNDK